MTTNRTLTRFWAKSISVAPQPGAVYLARCRHITSAKDEQEITQAQIALALELFENPIVRPLLERYKMCIFILPTGQVGWICSLCPKPPTNCECPDGLARRFGLTLSMWRHPDIRPIIERHGLRVETEETVNNGAPEAREEGDEGEA